MAKQPKPNSEDTPEQAGSEETLTTWKMGADVAAVLRKISANTGLNQQETLRLFLKTYEDYYFTLIQRELDLRKKKA